MTTNAANEYVVHWPVQFDFKESLGSSGRSYTVYTGPYDPGGVFTWNGSGSGGGGAMLMSASPGCGCASGNGRTVTMGCSRECDCGGGCVASGSFGFEGIGLAVTGGVCPQRVEGCNARAYTNGLAPGVAGGLQLRQGYRIHPLTVSFEGLSIEEVPCDEVIPPQGYFAFTPTNIFLRSHTRKAGAGEWVEVTEGNWVGGEMSFDKAGYLSDLPRMMPDGTATTNTAFGWLGGSLTWKVPFGWNKKPFADKADQVGTFAEGTRQVFRINANGDFFVDKLKHTAERKLSGETSVYDTPADVSVPEN